MSQVKETLRKERGEGQILKRKYDDTLTELERLKEAYQILQSNKCALILSATIAKGEKKDLEDKVADLRTQNHLLVEQLKVANEKQLDIAPFRNQVFLLQKEVNHSLLRMVGETYMTKQIEARLKEIALSSLEFWKRLSDVVELVKNQLAWIVANSTFPANMPQKTMGSLKMEVAILNLGCKEVVRLNTVIDRTIEKYTEFYKSTCSIHNQCMIFSGHQRSIFPSLGGTFKELTREAAKRRREHI